jgi:hypothetical protein
MKIPKKKLPRDSNQRAYEIVRLSVEEPEEPETPIEPTPAIEEPKKERSAISEYLSTIGRKGGLKGGKVRAEKLTAERRSEIARKAAATRWKKDK